MVLASLLRSVLTVAASMSSTLWLVARTLSIVLRSALPTLLWLVWLLAVVLWSMLATALWWLMLVIWVISAIVWSARVVVWTVWRSL